MPAALSFGDIYAVCTLIKNVCKALDQSRGASAEYRNIVSELWTLDDVLAQVNEVWGDNGDVDFQPLRVALMSAVKQCHTCIETFLEKVMKYDKSLGKETPIYDPKSSLRKIQWQACRSDELTKFRAEIIAHTTSLNVISTAATL